MLPTSMDGVSLFDYLDSLDLQPNLVVSFMPYSMGSSRLQLSGEDCYDAILRSYNAFYGSKKRLDEAQRLPLCGAMFFHRSVFLKLMRFIACAIDNGMLGSCNATEREHGQVLERCVGVHTVLEEGLQIRAFPLWHSFAHGSDHSPLELITSRTGLEMIPSGFASATAINSQIMGFLLDIPAAQEKTVGVIGSRRVHHERHVLRALYGQGEHMIDVTGVIKTFVAHRYYEFVASNALAGDPCCNVPKILKIVFDDGYSVTLNEGNVVSLEPLLR